MSIDHVNHCRQKDLVVPPPEPLRNRGTQLIYLACRQRMGLSAKTEKIRSSLSQAVLPEHAKQGFLNMPAKGGEDTLSEPMVAAAADYMFERTHTDLPPDR